MNELIVSFEAFTTFLRDYALNIFGYSISFVMSLSEIITCPHFLAMHNVSDASDVILHVRYSLIEST